METPNGVLQPQAAPEISDGPLVNGEYPRVETIAMLHRRWYTGGGSADWYICAAGGLLFQKQAHSSQPWAQVSMPLGKDSFDSNVWSWCTYEISEHPGGDPDADPVTFDVLLISNDKDGMWMIKTPDLSVVNWGDVKTDYASWNDTKTLIWAKRNSDDPAALMDEHWSVEMVDTRTDTTDPDEPQKKFAVIERFSERIWGTGVPGEPDTLYYSNTYAPDDWTLNMAIPEDSAGDVLLPSWDGDKFYALKRFGDQLLAFKKNKIWRVMGVSPGEFTFSEQYGTGTEYFNTIAVDGERCFLADRNGAEIYDGMNTTAYGKQQIELLWRNINEKALSQMCAVLHERRYYLAFPTGESTVNNAMLIYNLDEGTILFYPDMMVEAFMPAGDDLYATSSDLPGKIMKINYDSWKTGAVRGEPAKWVSPWMDFGYKRIVKGGFDFYFMPEVQTEEVEFTISIQTEKKRKVKKYTCKPLTEEQLAIPKEHRMKRLHFSGNGRKFRIIIEVEGGNVNPWRIVGGLQLVVETDPD